MPGTFEFGGFNVYESLKKGKKSKKEDTRFYSMLGVRKKRPSTKKRRSLILGVLRKNVFRASKPKGVIVGLGKVHAGKKDRTKQDPEYFWGLHSILRRKS